MNISELITASDNAEFFYEDSHEQVAEGDPVGVEWESDSEIKLCLFKNIYHEFKYEEDE